MQRIVIAGLAGIGFASWLVAARAADIAPCIGCTGPLAGTACTPDCTASWQEKKSSKPEYTMKCEYACARARDAWHAAEPACRRHPPAGTVYVKKRLYKSDGEPTVERVPKYETRMVPAAACDCAACRRSSALPWDPLGITSLSRSR